MEYHVYKLYWDRKCGANDVDPDQMLQNAASDLGLHCLPLHPCLYRSVGGIMDLFKFLDKHDKELRHPNI